VYCALVSFQQVFGKFSVDLDSFW